MIFAFSGAPGVGKTALTHAVSERLGYAALEIRSGDLLARRGFDLSSAMSRLRRIAAQELLLENLETILRSIEVPTIVDRSPVDLIAGMMCEVGPQDSPALSNRIMAYVEACLALTRRYYHGVLIVRPAAVPASPSQGPSSAFLFHVQAIIESAATRLRGDILTQSLRTSRFEDQIAEAVDIIDLEEHEFRAELERERLGLH